MNIAVIGAGLSGLSTSWYLLQHRAKVDLFDPLDIGKGASGHSTGLINPFPAKHTRKTLFADESLREVKYLLQVAQENTSTTLAEMTGLFKKPLNEEQKKEFTLLAQKHPELSIKNLYGAEGLFISTAITVHPQNYLDALFAACKKSGLRYFQKEVSLDDLSSYDTVVIATGHNTALIEKFMDVPFSATKGQMLVCKWPDNVPKLTMSIAAKGHISPFDEVCYIGSTYERNFTDDKPNSNSDNLLTQVSAFFPLASEFAVLEKRAGIRLKRKGHYIPFVGRLDAKCWAITGMGSRGLLYHALLGKQLAEAIIEDDEKKIPQILQEKVIL